MHRNPYFIAKCMALPMLAIILAIALLLMPPLPQDPAYHNFRDDRIFINIRYFLNVITNGLFLLVGCFGLWWNYSRRQKMFFHIRTETERHLYGAFFFALILLAFASGFYHWDPSNNTLLWDRLAIILAEMTLFAAIIAERIQIKAGLWCWPFLVLLGCLSVLYWHHTEMMSAGDLRAYLFMQFYPLLSIVLILILFDAHYSGWPYLVYAIVIYLLARVPEYYDSTVFNLTYNMISGHSVKHIMSGIACLFIIIYLHKRASIIHVRSQL